MNLRFGIYDIFSRIVPGGFYLFAFVELVVALNWIKFDWTLLSNVSLVISLGLIVVAYIIGTAMDRVGSAWYRLFTKRGMSNRVLEELKQRYSEDWNIQFEDRDWTVWRTYVYIHNPTVADEIDRNNAVSIMLGNLSFGLVIFAIAIFIEFINSQTWVLLALMVFILFLSYQIAIEARTSRYFYYLGIFQAIIAYRLNIEERVIPVKRTSKRRDAK